MKTNKLLFLFFVIALIAISSCAKPECRTSSDCLQRKCFIAKCDDKKCSYNVQKNCCGNRINDTIEDGKPGNKCTCPEDYGKCEGKGKVKIGSKLEDAAYVKYYCSTDRQCIFGVDKVQVSQQNFLDPISAALFKASSIVKYSNPFDVGKDYFQLTISVDDANKDLVFPIKIVEVKLLYSSQTARIEQLVAQKDLDNVLNGIGDQAIIEAPLNLNYKPQELEEQGSIRYSIDYTYTRKVPGKLANGTATFTEETSRATFNSPTKPVFFVRTA